MRIARFCAFHPFILAAVVGVSFDVYASADDLDLDVPANKVTLPGGVAKTRYRIYSVSTNVKGQGVEIHGFNATGFSLARTTTTAGKFETIYEAKAKSAGHWSGQGNVGWVIIQKKPAGVADAWFYTGLPPLPEDGKSVQVTTTDLRPGRGALWLSMNTPDGGKVGFLIVRPSKKE